jgi:RNA polymerase sigma factor FliA
MSKTVNEATLAEHMHLVHRIVARFARRLPRSVRREDLVAAGTLGLFNALRSSDHTCEEMFASYARIRIRGSIVDELRRNDWSPRRRRGAPELTLVSPSKAPPVDPNAPVPVVVVGFDDLPPHTLGSFDTTSGGATYGAASPFDQLEEKAEHEVLHRLVAQLPEREREIVQLRYFDGIPSKDVARTLGLSEARISQLHARAMGRLRAMVAEAGCDVELAA